MPSLPARIPFPRLTAAALSAIAIVVARELAFEFAADWLKDHVWVLGDFLSWRWSSILLAVVGAAAVLGIWQAIDRDAGHAPTHASPSEDVVVLEPTDGSKVGRIFKVHGYALTFEGNIVVERRRSDGTWEVVGITTAGMMEGHTPFSLQVGLSTGRHHLRIGSGSPVDGEWSGVGIRVIVQNRKRESTWVDYAGVRWVHCGDYHPETSIPKVTAACPEHGLIALYREVRSGRFAGGLHEPTNGDTVGPLGGALLCLAGGEHIIDVDFARLGANWNGVSFEQMRASAENILRDKLKAAQQPTASNVS